MPDTSSASIAVAAAAFMASREDEGSLLLVLPSDHVITNLEGFYRALDFAAPAAQSGMLVTFGMKPSKVESGYGHIQCGESLDALEGCYRVARFVEKPEAALAHSMLTEGGWYWNSDMFLFSAASYLEELERLQPEIERACRAAVEGGRANLDFFRLDGTSFCDAPSISIDYAVMEHTMRAAVVPADMGWSDVGSWNELWELGEKDGDGNVTLGKTIAEGVQDCYLRAEGQLLAAIGVRDLLIVATEDAVLVAAKDRAQDVKKHSSALEGVWQRAAPHTLEGVPALGNLPKRRCRQAISGQASYG